MKGDNMVPDIPRNPIDVAGLEGFLFAADGKYGSTGQQHADLFVWMGVFLDNGIGLNVNN